MTQIISSDVLVRVLKGTPAGQSKYVLFLGAGASASSGVKTGAQLVAEWRNSFNELATDRCKPAEHQSWYGKSTEYSKLFEYLYQTPAQRRDFIETCIQNATPSWGYLYLADLLDRRFFNVVLTTNFDDLLTEACYSFTQGLRPLVCSHDANIQLFRLSGPRPKIIKLHGDFLFDNIKNTVKEVTGLEDNTRNLLSRLAAEFGFIVLGYGGGDESIMSTLSELLRDKGSFPNGLYWCVRDASRLPDRLSAICEDLRVHIVQVDDFDEFLAATHTALVGTPPRVLAEPFTLAQARLAHLLSGLHLTEKLAAGLPTPLKRDFELLAKSIKVGSKQTIQLPIAFIAAIKFQEGDYTTARGLLLQDHLKGEPSIGTTVLFFETLRHAWDEEACHQVISLLEERLDKLHYDPAWMLNATLSLLHGKHYDEAERIALAAGKVIAANRDRIEPHLANYNDINLAQITLHRGQQLSDVQNKTLNAVLRDTDQSPTKFGCNVLLGNHSEAVNIVESNRDDFPASTADWPIVQLLPFAQANKLKELTGTGQFHFGELKLDFKVPLRQRS